MNGIEHPFVTGLSNKTLDELSTTMMELNNKLSYAMRTGNGPLIAQLQMAMQSFRAERDKKMDALFQKKNVDATIKVEKKR